MSAENRKRPVKICVGCKRLKKIVFHEPTPGHQKGDDDRPMCANCRKKFKAAGPGAFKLSKLKGCIAALAGLETLKTHLDEDQQEPLLNCQEFIGKLLSQFSTEEPEAEVPERDKEETEEEQAARTEQEQRTKEREDYEEKHQTTAEELKVGAYFTHHDVLHAFNRISKTGKLYVRRWNGTRWTGEINFERSTPVSPYIFETAEKFFPGVTEAKTEGPQAKPPVKGLLEKKTEAAGEAA
jgi:hypothetical protein